MDLFLLKEKNVTRLPLHVSEPRVVQGWTLSLTMTNSHTTSPCLPWGATCEVDDGILVEGSWLYLQPSILSLTIHFSARGSCRREVRYGPTWSIGLSRQAQKLTSSILLNYYKLCCIHYFILVALGAMATVNHVFYYLFIFCLTINHVISTMYPCLPESMLLLSSSCRFIPPRNMAIISVGCFRPFRWRSRCPIGPCLSWSGT